MMEKSFDFIEKNYREICSRVAKAAAESGRDPGGIHLIAVTKTVEPEQINRALRLGILEIGENRVQEYLSKRDEYELSGVKVHFIGSLQRNKVKQICSVVDTIDSVNSLSLAAEIQKQCEKIGKVMPVLVEINIGEEKTKTGIDSGDVISLLEAMSEMPNLKVEGLMAIPPYSEDIDMKRRYCHNMRKLFVDIKEKNIHNITMDRLSMGMSDDYEQAILEGATEIRIGTALFGRRRYK